MRKQRGNERNRGNRKKKEGVGSWDGERWIRQWDGNGRENKTRIGWESGGFFFGGYLCR